MHFVLLAALLAVATLLTGAPPCTAGGNCGPHPPRPPAPVGCRDIVPVCVCDQWGQNCHWQWQCVQ